MLEICNAKYKNGFKIDIEFSDSKKGEVDLKEFIENGKIKPFKELQDLEKFKNFSVDYTIKWGEGLDIAPEYLYFEAFKDKKELQEQFKKWGYIESVK